MKKNENPCETESANDANRGKLVAKLVPYEGEKKLFSRKELLEQFDDIREKVKGNVNIKSYISEGRKY
jgi:hypothetical protein